MSTRTELIIASVLILLLLSNSIFADNTILLDPGHGGSALGCKGANGKLYEKAVNLTVALAAKDTINFDYGGWFQVGMTRSTDVYVENIDRADSANVGNNGQGYAYFISTHHNSIDTAHNSTQGTEAWHCMSDTILGGSWRDVDSLMAQKIYLRLLENWDAPDDPYIARGLKKSCGLTVLIRNRRIAVLTEASFLSDSLEENLFADPANTHARSEAGAIYRGFKSYCDGAGIAEISNQYVQGKGGTIEVDDLELPSPVYRTWAIFEQHDLYAHDSFYLNGYWYYFHHWSHLRSDGTYLGPDYFENAWPITVPPENDSHIYRAYFTGGPYWADVWYLPWPLRYSSGDTVQFMWLGDWGADSSTMVSLYLDRHNGRDGYPEALVENVPRKMTNCLDWVVTGPACDSCILKVVAHDIADNQATGYTQDMETFAICTWKVGDADGSGAINISDAVYLIDHIFGPCEGCPNGPPPTPHNPGSGDADCSGSLSISDAVYLINYFFAGGPPPGQECNCADYS